MHVGIGVSGLSRAETKGMLAPRSHGDPAPSCADYGPEISIAGYVDHDPSQGCLPRIVWHARLDAVKRSTACSARGANLRARDWIALLGGVRRVGLPKEQPRQRIGSDVEKKIPYAVSRRSQPSLDAFGLVGGGARNSLVKCFDLRAGYVG
jgi:hypothetical protein